MKKYLIVLLLLGWVGVVWGQREEDVLTKLERKYRINNSTKKATKSKDTKIDDKTIDFISKLYESRIYGRVNKGVRPKETNTYVVEYNFGQGVFSRNRLAARVNYPMVFKITNINRLAYDINISSIDSILANSLIADDLSKWIPAASPVKPETTISQAANQSSTVDISANDVIHQGKDSEDKVKAIVADAENIQYIGREKEKLRVLKDTLEKVSSDYKEGKRQLNVLIAQRDSLLTVKKAMSDSSTNEKQYLQSYIDTLDRMKEKIKFYRDSTKMLAGVEEIRKKYSDQESKVKRVTDIKNKAFRKFSYDSENYITGYNALIKSYNNIRQLMVDYKEMLVICQNPNLTLESYSTDAKVKMDSVYSRLTSAFHSIESINDQLSQMGPLYAQIKYNPGLDSLLNFGGKIKLYAYIESLKFNVDMLQKGFDRKLLDAIASEMKECIPMLSREENYYIVSEPIQPKNDMVIFNIAIKKREGNSSKLIKERFFKHEEYIRKGLRFDLGIGLAGSFFRNAKLYDLERRDSATYITRKGRHTYVPSVIGLATLGFRSASYTTFGLSAGMGLDINEGEIQVSNFYTGPSLTLGRYDRVTITGGIALKNLNVLKSSYQVNKGYSASISESDVFTKRYHFGYFLSITYNLTKGMKNNIKYLKYIP
ncbi:MULTISPECIES: hypothetical protein [unclassified Sphingobacterium]|uniref:hypothetical protein n=1 Tax=unclassified Sphingobacterium TaxID=2609468 RepID=UPI0025D3F6B2|nr:MULTISPECIES: hypothetical protein [unclassified Sphingobacterium]